MGEVSLKERKQDPFGKGTTVHFFAFVKVQKGVLNYYLCRGVVVKAPSAYTNAPHKVRVTGVALSKFHKHGDREEGRTLLGKEMHLQVDKITQELSPWLAPNTWWS